MTANCQEETLFGARYSLFVIRYSLFVIRYSLFVVRCSLFVVRRSSFDKSEKHENRQWSRSFYRFFVFYE